MARQPRTLKQRIQLDGGKEIREELQSLGKTGERAFRALERAATGVEGPGRRLARAIDRIRRSLAQLAARAAAVGASFRRLRASFGNLATSLSRVVRRLGAVTAAAGVAAGGLFALARAGANAVDQATKTAQGLGLTIEEYTQLQFAAEQSGIEQEKFNNAISRLNQSIGETVEAAREGGQGLQGLGRQSGSLAEQWQANITGANRASEAIGEVEATGSRAAQAMQRLGIDVLDSEGNFRSGREVLLDMADAFRAMPDGAEESSLAIDIFGNRLARFMLPLLNQGREGILQLTGEADRLGVTLTEQEAAIGTAFVDALNRLTRAALGARNRLALLFAPSFTEGFDRLTELIRENQQALRAFGERAVAEALSVVDDLVALLQGRDTDVQRSFLIEMRDAVLDFAETARLAFENIIVPTFRFFMSLLDEAAELINRVFGTELTGRQIGIVLLVGQLTGALSTLAAALGVAGAAALLFFNTLGLLAPLVGVVIAIFGGIVTAVGAVGTAIAGLAAGAPALLIGAFAAAVAAIVIYWDDIVEAARAAFERLPELAGSAAEATAGVWRGFGAFFDDILSGIGDSFRSLWDGIVALAESAYDRIRAIWRRIRNLLASSREAAAELQASPETAPVLAQGGGPLRGPGTKTSDSILARLSRGEFVVRAAAVDHYGAGFLHRLNAMQLPKGRLPGFAVGGLVDGLRASLSALAPVPAYAAGGPALAPPAGAQGRPVVLNLDGQRYELSAREDVADRLTNSVLSQKRRRAGVMPSWFGG